MPIHSRMPSGYPVGDIVTFLLSESNEFKRCTTQPLGVAENATFLLDLDYVNYQDLKADDLGVWVPTGTKKVFFRFSSSGILKFTNKKSGNAVKSSYYTLTRRYYVHKSYDKYHRQIADIEGN